jgi:DNA-directed RNA polymerase specialized sigma24 family protein
VSARNGHGRLERLSDDGLVAFRGRALRRGDDEAAQRALELLVFRQWTALNRRLRAKLPPAAVEDVAAEVVLRAIGSRFDGGAAWQFRAWLATIAQRTVADWHGRRRRVVPQVPLPLDEAAAASPAVGDASGAVEVRMLVDEALGDLGDAHRRVVELLVFADRPASEAVQAVAGMSEANAYQVVRRFRQRVRGLLDERQDA